MKKGLNAGFLFVIFLICYWIHKFKFLALPYFWDELGVYIQWVYLLSINGISLSPDTVSPEFTRGHPPLFAFIYAYIFKWSNFSASVIHGFSLSITSLLGITIFLFIKKETNSIIALFSSILFLVQPIVLAQSTLVLPEVLIALFILISAISIYKECYWSYVFFASCALLTKESGLICVSSSLIYFLLTFKGDFKKRLYLVGVICSPLLVFASFFIVQKIQLGWFFFPYHISLMNFEVEKILDQFIHAAKFLFDYQGRIVFTIFIFILLISLFSSTISSKNKKLILLSFIFIFFGFLFSSLNFYMQRYLVMLIPFWVVLVAVTLSRLNLSNYLIVSLIALSLIKSRDCLRYRYFNYDYDYTFYDNIMAQKEAYTFIKENVKEGDLVYAVFPLWNAFNYEINGFENFRKIPTTHNPNEKYQWVAYVTVDSKDVIKDFSKLELVHHKTFGNMECSIYKVR